MIWFFLVAAAVVGLDHLSKWVVIQRLPRGQDVRVIGEWVTLTHIKNTGAAFGLFPGSIIPLIVISLAASVVVLVLARRAHGRFSRLLPLGLILGGAIGNLIDRIFAGRVTDFINVGIPGGPRWPVFNLADSAVTIGVAILAFGVYFGGHDRREMESGPASLQGAEAPAAAPLEMDAARGLREAAASPDLAPPADPPPEDRDAIPGQSG